MFDRNFEFISEASGVQQAYSANQLGDLAVMDLKIPANGYMYIYVSNESETNVNFDNLSIFHSVGCFTEENHYYPYGMLIEPLSTDAAGADNNYKYQDNELQTNLSYNVEEFALRHYDPAIGRWTMHDPITQFANPYIGMGDNPVFGVDPLGSQMIATKNSSDAPYNSNSNIYSHYMDQGYSSAGAMYFAINFGVSNDGGGKGGGGNAFVDASGKSYTTNQLFALIPLTRLFKAAQFYANANNVYFDFNASSYASGVLAGDITFEFSPSVNHFQNQQQEDDNLTASTGNGIYSSQHNSKWSWLGDEGGENFNGKCFGGTNFVGPQPEGQNPDPMKTGLRPICEEDYYARSHDNAYLKAGTGGYWGALLNLNVRGADLALVVGSASVINRYDNRYGIGNDHWTGNPISEREFNIARTVLYTFAPIVTYKYEAWYFLH